MSWPFAFGDPEKVRPNWPVFLPTVVQIPCYKEICSDLYHVEKGRRSNISPTLELQWAWNCRTPEQTLPKQPKKPQTQRASTRVVIPWGRTCKLRVFHGIAGGCTAVIPMVDQPNQNALAANKCTGPRACCTGDLKLGQRADRKISSWPHTLKGGLSVWTKTCTT